jgi:transcription elongation factor GreA
MGKLFQSKELMKQIRFTKEGYEELKAKYEDLLKQRPAVVEDLKKAREMGDLKENGYYKASRSKLSFIDSRLRQYKLALKQAVIITRQPSTTVDIGSTVLLTDKQIEKRYQIVGDLEANPSEGKISLLSPLGQAIAGKKVGDEAIFQTPRGEITYKISSIS